MDLQSLQHTTAAEKIGRCSCYWMAADSSCFWLIGGMGRDKMLLFFGLKLIIKRKRNARKENGPIFRLEWDFLLNFGGNRCVFHHLSSVGGGQEGGGHFL
jgi:hypothetical protein